MKVKNQYQRRKLKKEIARLTPEEQGEKLIEFYRDGTTFKLLAALFDCYIGDIVDYLMLVDIKICCRCKMEKSWDDFHIAGGRSTGYHFHCKDCAHDTRKEFYEKNEKGNPEVYDKMISWKRKHSFEYNERRNNRRATDITFRLNYWLSNSIYLSLRNKSVSKDRIHWESLVEYTCDDLKQHLEEQFSTDMNWQNHGTYWELDHIVPVSAFNFTSVDDIFFKRCWSLINLRPLEKSINKSKSNNISHEWGNVELTKQLLDKDIV